MIRDAIDRFLACANQNPSSLAIQDGSAEITYRDLESHARVLAARFASKINPMILIVLPKGVDAYAGMIAAGLVGGTYSPLNVAAPHARWLEICRLLRPDIILAKQEDFDILGDASGGALLVDPTQLSGAPPLVGPGTRHRNAYVIFTSGSTGSPKGVVVRREGLNHYVNWIGKAFCPTPSDRVSQYANIGFDLSVLEIYGALCFGASLHPVVEYGDRIRPARFIKSHRLTIWVSVPTAVTFMIQGAELTPDHIQSVRQFVFCGEPLLADTVRTLKAVSPNATIMNTYGPTETTVSVTAYTVTSLECLPNNEAVIALGDPISGMDVHLVGGSNRDEGEVVITGPQVAWGYLHDERQTREAFRDVQTLTGVARGYYTGDWAVRREGRLFFQGRMDFQVKVNGFRVEIEEVESAIAHSHYPVCCVAMIEQQLVAGVEIQPGTPCDLTELRRDLLNRLESHAVPSKFLRVSSIPRDQNGKIDRKLATVLLRSLIA
jgi:D-alanine--poly(phosphoribitol) ligase subunit 1